MIRIERDPAWWADVASHPGISASLMGIAPQVIGALASREDVLPLAAQHGGFMFRRTDALGLTMELHSLFTPEGWGREVHDAGREALTWIFQGCHILTTYELEANSRSRPPKAFGFVQAGDWRETAAGTARAWVLTRLAWEASPAFRRMNKCHWQ